LSRAAVLEKATHLFAEHGFDGTTVQAIADAVGVTKAAVLHHFASKEELRSAVMESMLEHWQKLLPDLLLRASAGGDRFDAVFDALLGFFMEDADRARIALREAFDRPAEMRRLLHETVRAWIEAVAVYVDRGREWGACPPDIDPQAYVGLIMLFVISAASVRDVASGVIDGDVVARIAKETKRIAKASLFTPRA
jgi:AcrR family transcriptional regulator